MLMKFLMCHVGMYSYSARKVLVKCLKSQTGENLRCYFYLQSRYISGKAEIQDQAIQTPHNESEEHDKEEKKEKRKRVKVQKLNLSDEIYNAMCKISPIEVLNAFPKRYFRRHRTTTEPLYLVNPHVADTIVQHIRNSILKPGAIVLEDNPGLGILSKKLIDAGVTQLHLHEPLPTFHKIVKNLQCSHSDIVTLHLNDFFSHWKLVYLDKMDGGTRVEDILSHYPRKNWTEEPVLKIIGCVRSADFIKHLIYSIVFQRGLMKHCRPEFYVLVQPSLHLNLTCSGADGYRRYRNISVFFQVFFDFELLEQIPRKAFLPWPTPAPRMRQHIEEIVLKGEEWLYLMKIVPKKDLFEILSPEKLPAFWHFVRHHFWKRSNRVIPEMESWIPGCGLRLILEGYTIFTEFGDLKPKEVLNMFQQFSSWPEYQDSSFLPSVETAILKLDENYEEEGRAFKNR